MPTNLGRGRWRQLRRTRASGFFLVLTLIALWQASVSLHWVESDNWPSVVAVAVSFWHGIASGELVEIIGSTLWRMARGYAAGTALGVVLGITLASWRPAKLAFMPTHRIAAADPRPGHHPTLDVRARRR